MPNQTLFKPGTPSTPSFNGNLTSDLLSVAALLVCFMLAVLAMDISPVPFAALPLSPMVPLALLNIAILIVASVLALKSNLKAQNHIFSFLITVISIIMNTLSHTSSLLNVPFCLMLPSVVLYLTRSYFQSGVSMFVQLINILLIFRINMEEAIRAMTARELTDRLSQCLTLGLIFWTFSFIYVFHLKEGNTSQNMFTFPASISPQQQIVTFKPEKILYNFINEAENSVQNILGSLDLLLTHAESGLGAKILKIAKTSTEELKRTLNNLVEINKGENEKNEANDSLTCIRTLFKAIWENISLLIQKKELYGTLKIDANVPRSLEVDPQKLNQVILNILNYFLEVTAKGSINFLIECPKESCLDDDETLSDIDSLVSESHIEEISSIFNYFKTISVPQRQPKTNKKEKMLRIVMRNFDIETFQKKNGGYSPEPEAKDLPAWILSDMTKLGLCVSKKIVEQLGGNLKVYERKSKETTFEMNIPVKILAEN